MKEGLAAGWRALGLHRMQHRTIRIQTTADALVVSTRVAPAGTDLGLLARYGWSAVDDALVLTLDVEPDGAWPSRCHGSASGSACPATSGWSNGSGAARERPIPTPVGPPGSVGS